MAGGDHTHTKQAHANTSPSPSVYSYFSLQSCDLPHCICFLSFLHFLPLRLLMWSYPPSCLLSPIPSVLSTIKTPLLLSLLLPPSGATRQGSPSWALQGQVGWTGNGACITTPLPVAIGYHSKQTTARRISLSAIWWFVAVYNLLVWTHSQLETFKVHLVHVYSVGTRVNGSTRPTPLGGANVAQSFPKYTRSAVYNINSTLP